MKEGMHLSEGTVECVSNLQQRRSRAALALVREDLVVVVLVSEWGGGERGDEGQCEGCRRLAACRCVVLTVKF